MITDARRIIRLKMRIFSFLETFSFCWRISTSQSSLTAHRRRKDDEKWCGMHKNHGSSFTKCQQLISKRNECTRRKHVLECAHFQSESDLNKIQLIAVNRRIMHNRHRNQISTWNDYLCIQNAVIYDNDTNWFRYRSKNAPRSSWINQWRRFI